MKLKTHVWWVGLLAMASLLLVIGDQVRQRWEPMQQAERALAELLSMEGVAGLVHELQRERGLSSAFLGGADLLRELEDQRRRTDASRLHASEDLRIEWLNLAPLIEHRRAVSQRSTTASASQSFYTQLISGTIDRAAARGMEQDDGPLRREMTLHTDLMRAKEHLGQLRAIVAQQLADSVYGVRSVIESQRHVAVFDEYIVRYLSAADDARQLALRRVVDGAAMARLTARLHDHAASNAGAEVDLPSTRAWFDTATQVIDELRLVELASLQRARAAARDAIERQRARMMIGTGILAGAWAIVALALLLSLRRLMQVLSLLIVNTRRLLRQVDGANATDTDFSQADDLEAGWTRVLDQAERLQQQASVDALTGVFNRRGLDATFARERSRAQRHQRSLSLLLLDLDHFKQVNDRFGHGAGDRVLRETCGRLRHALRRDDTLGRWGGEEFVVIAPETDEHAARQLADKLREAVSASPFNGIGVRTVSIGVAQWRPDESIDQLCARADLALYAAKAAGRDRCICASELDGPSDPDGSSGLRLVSG